MIQISSIFVFHTFIDLFKYTQCQWVQVENYTSTFQMQVVKSTIVFIPVACDPFVLYIVCYTILAGLQWILRQAKMRIES
jgi:hypothetical protein